MRTGRAGSRSGRGRAWQAAIALALAAAALLGTAAAANARAGLRQVIAFGTGHSVTGVALGHLSVPDDLDIVTSNADGTVTFIANVAQGVFLTPQTVSSGQGPAALGDVAVADLDGDGYLDVAVTDEAHGRVIVMWGDGSPSPLSPNRSSAFPVGNGPKAIAIGDMDGDGRPDIVAAGDSLSVLIAGSNRNFGSLTSTPVQSRLTDVELADADGDGDLDVLTGDDSSSGVRVWSNSGFGAFGFTPGQLFGGALSSIALGDFDGDGRVDVAGAAPGSPLVVASMHAPGSGFESAISHPLAGGGAPASVVAADFDADGRDDLAVIEPSSRQVALLNGQPSHSQPFADASRAELYTSDPETAAVSAAAGDLNGDGLADLVVGTASGEQRVMVLLGQHVASLLAAPPASATIGETAADSVTLSDVRADAGGSITFSLYGPDDPDCSGAPLWWGEVPVSGPGVYRSSAQLLDHAGAYRWSAEYWGGDQTISGESGCEDPAQTTTVAKAAPSLTQAASDASLGTPVADAATLAGGYRQTGTLVFRAWADGSCAGQPAFESGPVPVAGDGTYASPPFDAPAPGDYRWETVYSGDGDNDGTTTACGSDDGISTVTQPAPDGGTAKEPPPGSGALPPSRLPAPRITAGPPALGRAKDARVAFAAVPGARGYECRLDDGPWTPCNSPFVLAGVDAGDHMAAVRAVGTDGSPGAAKQVSFQVNPYPPGITLASARLRASRAGVVAVVLGCSPREGAGHGACRGTIRLRAAGRDGRLLGGARFRARAGKRTVAHIHLSRAARAALRATRGGIATRLTIAARDLAGNRRTTTIRTALTAHLTTASH
ncbi:FG-GAP-like repeat-containing protein [Conexibacter sp. CPCC 206217]|uniref:FG-GAP-like repeat-containing protein n=1 Tax=Conexibacter sp. CPCC 206217 TaxID=3064574 RepID=UPI002721A579|nr:FG-GAP-like repeat-containing protein [Conexibacter sp. CPCC 206217]MDO8209640.1 FG-GAP-like repeat-containing protein [Conexibacter sp. CPCC 206217]